MLKLKRGSTCSDSNDIPWHNPEIPRACQQAVTSVEMYPGTSFEMASDWTNCDHMNTSFEGNDGLIRPWGVDYTQVNSQLVHGQFNNIILRWSGLARISYPRWPVPMLQNVDECKVDKVDRIWKPVWKRLWPTDLACINIFEFLVWLRDRRIFYKGHVNLPQSFPFALSFDALWRFWRSSAFVSRIPRWSKMIQDEWLALTHVFHVK